MAKLPAKDIVVLQPGILGSVRYDQVGNMQLMQHATLNLPGQTGSWTRYYETAAESNRLMRT